jgi:hypothetical protein
LDPTAGTVYVYRTAGCYEEVPPTSVSLSFLQKVSTSDGGGSWLVSTDGFIVAFGHVNHFGARSSDALNKPVDGLATNAE